MSFRKSLTAAVIAAFVLTAHLTLAQGGVSNTDTGAGRVSARHINGSAVNATKLSDGLLEGKYVFCRTDSQPVLTAASGNAVATGATGDLNIAHFTACGLDATYHVKGAVQTLLGPLLDTTGLGLDISQDQTDNEGVEYVFGSNNSYGRFAHTVSAATDACFRVKSKIADVSGTDDYDIGWRKVETAQANVDDYDEAAWVNVNLGALQTETILNAAATTTTVVTLPSVSTAWIDNAVHTVEVCIKGRRAHYYYDGLEVQKTVAFNFDLAEVIEPFIFFMQATTSPGKVFLQEVEIYDGNEARPGNGS